MDLKKQRSCWCLRKQSTRQCNPNPTYRVLAGLHWPNSGAAPPPTHSMGEEGSQATCLDPTQGTRANDPGDNKRNPGDYRKVSTHREQEKPAQETGRRSSEVE